MTDDDIPEERHSSFGDQVLGTAAIADADGGFQAHISEGGCCIFCNVSNLDDDVYGPFACITRGQFSYTSETPQRKTSRS
ncbi:hypothetical protein [Cryobacterium zhongshanensis]|uniref:Uncharacterized protein n=1 Tax=Cryobacterium zhongshanensis TaxID=2928153 RepID=A0AA41QYK7_9MICO|nr:hypothetical protein [Cryobacterium zhongshanensis]MCI4659549.1 hypothetical protein [Cryobacterium zhongshanensis]